MFPLFERLAALLQFDLGFAHAEITARPRSRWRC